LRWASAPNAGFDRLSTWALNRARLPPSLVVTDQGLEPAGWPPVAVPAPASVHSARALRFSSSVRSLPSVRRPTTLSMHSRVRGSSRCGATLPLSRSPRPWSHSARTLRFSSSVRSLPSVRRPTTLAMHSNARGSSRCGATLPLFRSTGPWSHSARALRFSSSVRSLPSVRRPTTLARHSRVRGSSRGTPRSSWGPL
jgi:hypothetical protein